MDPYLIWPVVDLSPDLFFHICHLIHLLICAAFRVSLFASTLSPFFVWDEWFLLTLKLKVGFGGCELGFGGCMGLAQGLHG